MFNKHDISRNECQLFWHQAKHGYDTWRHSFTAHHATTGEKKSFFIEYFLCNPLLGDDRPHFGRLGRTPSYMMVKAGTWGEGAAQLHRFFGWDHVKLTMAAPFSVEADDCFVSEDRISGEISISEIEAESHPEYMCQYGSMKWQLKIDKKIAFNIGYGAGRLFRELQLSDMFWHAEGMKTGYHGEVIWNGEKYIVDSKTCYGYADKIWGKDLRSPLMCLSSNDLTSEITGKRLNDSAFSIFTLKREPLSALWYEGQEYEFNFMKFWSGCKTIFDCKETETQIIWHIDQRTRKHRMITEITCDKKDMLLANYEAPDGKKRYNRLWKGGNGNGTIQLFTNEKLVDRIHAENIRCEYGEAIPVTQIHKSDIAPFITKEEGNRTELSYQGERFQIVKDKKSLLLSTCITSEMEQIKSRSAAIADIVEKLSLKYDEKITISNKEIRIKLTNYNKTGLALRCIHEISARLRLIAALDLELYEEYASLYKFVYLTCLDAQATISQAEKEAFISTMKPLYTDIQNYLDDYDDAPKDTIGRTLETLVQLYDELC